MSGGVACMCPKPSAGRTPVSRQALDDWRRGHWHVYQRYCNHSAFNGYHRTPSSWSSVGCKTCNSVWRTKADYVTYLPDYQGAA